MRNAAFQNFFFSLAEFWPATLVLLLGLFQSCVYASEEGPLLRPEANSLSVETAKPTAPRIDLLKTLTNTESTSVSGIAEDELLDPDDALFLRLLCPIRRPC